MQAFSSETNTPGNGRPSPSVSVVIPALNEERNLPHVFAKLPAGITEVIVVDGGSVDRTVEVARELRPDVKIVQQTRKGKGNALACGFAACTGDIIVMIDADGSTDPAEIPQFIAALLAGADFVKGSRFGEGGHSHDITPLRKLGNDGLNLTVNVLFGTRFTDLCYGYNAFWARVVPALELPATSLPQPADGSKLWGDGFEIETMINIRAAAQGLKVAEVPSIEHERIFGESNLNTFRDGTRVLRTILSEWFLTRRARRQARRGVQARPAAVEHAAGSATSAAAAAAVAAIVPAPAPRLAADHQVDPRPAHLNRAVRTPAPAERAVELAPVTAEER